ncbi:hypothetical protein HY632_01595 [Candidatus Uhrbacteria bacterium]|nr:hypothetical protein [Candidatus Uhrbacteria bacterium]
MERMQLRSFLLGTALILLMLPSAVLADTCSDVNPNMVEDPCGAQIATRPACIARSQLEVVRRGCPSGSPSGASGAVLENPLPSSDIPTIVGTVMKAGFGILGSLALLMFTYGGFLWLTSGGSPEMIKKGRNTMVWAAMGIGVVFAAYTIVDFLITSITSS